MTDSTISEILNGCTDEYEIISLAGKKINGCISCTVCAENNMCVVEDDWTEIGEKMIEADIIIFGAPNYFGTINAIAHACLERTFAFRHRGAYPLQDKLGVIVTTCETRDVEDPVATFIERMFTYNKVNTIAKMQVNQFNQCYTCGYGEDCYEGAVVRKFGVLEEILPCHLPKQVLEQEETLNEIKYIRDALAQHGVSF